ncbi:MAG: glucose/arabinose dehydrogenase [Woeseiaceae bacterium]
MTWRKTIVTIIFALTTCSGLRAQSDVDLGSIKLPPGFSIELWTDEVPNARSLTSGDDGTVFVSTRRDGRIYAVTPRAGEKPVVRTLATNLKVPNGIAFFAGDLYVAENHRILRYQDIKQNLESVADAEVVVSDLPTESHHGWRYMDFSPDGKLYVSIGAPCNVCDRQGFARIIRMNPDGSEREVVARGVRNSVGFGWHPQSGELWFTDNGRDMLGDDIPPGELNRVSRPGMHFGFPFCHGDDIADPEYGEQRQCSEFESPAQKLDPHVAPLGMMFYGGDMFPAKYQGQVFIAEHGSWNRSRKIGYRISLVRLQRDRTDRTIGYEVFAEGWLQDEVVSGRPVDLLSLADGSLLVSDDKNGAIYRISYSRPLDEGVASPNEDAHH